MRRIPAAIAPLAAFLGVFFYAPFIVLAYQSFLGLDGAYTVENYLAILRDPAYARVLAYSAVIALETTLATLLISYPASYYIALYAGGREKILMLSAMIAPFWVDFLLRALSIKALLYSLGLREGYAAMMVGMVYDYLPFMFLPLYASMTRIRRSLLEAARSLGASGPSLVRRIILPLTLPGILAGSILVFLMSMTEYVIPSLLGGTQGFTVGTLIYYLFLSGGMWGVGAALTMVVTVGLMVLSVVVARRAEVWRW